MSRLIIRCYAELNDFLDEPHRQSDMSIEIPSGATLADAAEGLGIPLDRIDLALIDGQSMPLSAQPGDGSRVSLFPVFESFDISSASAVSGAPLRDPRFVLDASLFKLGRHLRMLGFDAEFGESLHGRLLIEVSLQQKRTLLSRSPLLCSNRRLTHVFRIQLDRPQDQLFEVLKRFDLIGMIRPLTRCLCCNSPVLTIGKADIEAVLPPQTQKCFDDFRFCSHCRKTYWEGGHHRRMSSFIEEMRRRVESE